MSDIKEGLKAWCEIMFYDLHAEYMEKGYSFADACRVAQQEVDAYYAEHSK